MGAGEKSSSTRMDNDRFEALYSRYGNDVLRMSYFYLRDRQRAEDVTQEVFLRLLMKNPDLPPGREKSWLLKVAMNRCRDVWRSTWVRRVVLGEGILERKRVSDRTEAFVQREELLDALERLTPSLKEAILLYYYQGYGVEEMAGLLGIPMGTVSSRLSRAREKIGEFLKESEEP